MLDGTFWCILNFLRICQWSVLVYGVVMLLVYGFTLMQKKALVALEDAGIFTSGGLVKDKVRSVLFILY